MCKRLCIGQLIVFIIVYVFVVLARGTSTLQRLSTWSREGSRTFGYPKMICIMWYDFFFFFFNGV